MIITLGIKAHFFCFFVFLLVIATAILRCKGIHPLILPVLFFVS